KKASQNSNLSCTACGGASDARNQRSAKVSSILLVMGGGVVGMDEPLAGEGGECAPTNRSLGWLRLDRAPPASVFAKRASGEMILAYRTAFGGGTCAMSIVLHHGGGR